MVLYLDWIGRVLYGVGAEIDRASGRLKSGNVSFFVTFERYRKAQIRYCFRSDSVYELCSEV